MASHAPSVSIGLPVYNGERYLAEAIDCVLAQTYTDFELIISDNASTDQTAAICQQYAEQDARIKYFRSEVNRGAAWNFNRVFELSQGAYFKWHAHDDLIEPTFLEKCVTVLDADPTVVLSYPQVYIVDANRNILHDYTLKFGSDASKPSVRFRELLIPWSLCFEIFGLIRSDALRATPVMGNYAHGDGVLLARLGLMGRFVEVPEKLFLSRRHSEQSMQTHGLNYHTYTVWFDPKKANKIVFPRWRILFENLKSIWSAGLSVSQIVLCHLVMLLWLRRYARALLTDVWVAFREYLRRKTFLRKSTRNSSTA